MFSSGTEYEIFRYNNCENCEKHKENPRTGFPALPKHGGCGIEDLLERARFDEDLFPEAHIRKGRCLDFKNGETGTEGEQKND